jgi:hypothetical protein
MYQLKNYINSFISLKVILNSLIVLGMMVFTLHFEH